MKTWLEKFRASTALDRGDKPQTPGQSDEARRFEESLRATHRELRTARASGEVPPDLHASVMRAVRKSRTESEPAVTGLLLRRLAATALVLAAGVGVFWSVNRPSGKVATDIPPSLAVAFDQGHELTQVAPQAVLGPLSGEMELLHRDFQNAVTFLAANVPSVD